MTGARLGFLAGAAVLALGAVLTGCVPEHPVEPTASNSPTATSTETPSAAPALVPEGTAAENLPYFTQIVQSVWAGPSQVQGRAYVDALVSGGFDKSTMQLTPDQTTIGNPAESIQFSVLWRDGNCLIGQAGPATGGAVTVVEPAVRGGTACLLGNTRPIDW